MYLLLVYLADSKRLFVRSFDVKPSESLCDELHTKLFNGNFENSVHQLRKVSISAMRTISDFKRSVIRFDNPNYKEVVPIAF